MPKRPHALLLALAVAIPGAARAASCTDTLLSNRDLTRFAALIQASGLAPQVARGQVTVFAPTNAALDRIAGVTQMLNPQNSSGSPDFPRLQTLVRAHLVSGLHPENGMHATLTLPTLAGTTVAVDGTGQRSIALTSRAANTVNLSGMHLMPAVHVAGPVLDCDGGLIYPIDGALVQ